MKRGFYALQVRLLRMAITIIQSRHKNVLFRMKQEKNGLYQIPMGQYMEESGGL